MPKRYVMANGDTIPLACAEAIEPGVIKLGNYYIEFKLEKPYFVRPKAGKNVSTQAGFSFNYTDEIRGSGKISLLRIW